MKYGETVYGRQVALNTGFRTAVLYTEERKLKMCHTTHAK